MSHRLEAPAGAWIDRSRPVSFTFNGRTFSGFSGDTLASALLANGVRIVGRSFKYHRPRGVFAAGVEEPNALVRLREGARPVDPHAGGCLEAMAHGASFRAGGGSSMRYTASTS